MTAAGALAAVQTVVVMGVSGAGKTAVGAAAAAAVGRRFLDADDLHPQRNRDKMAAGHPLTDEDRWPWLDRVADAAAGEPTVVACSALRRVYRDRLRERVPGHRTIAFVELDVSREELERRLAARSHAFMPASLLDSQLATLEPLQPDEPGLRVSADGPLDQVVAAVAAALRPGPAR